MIIEIKQDAEKRMRRSVETLNDELSRMRTGRAHTSLIEHISVDYYGNPTPLNQLSNIAVEDSRMLSVTPWDKSSIPAVEKAILNADLGLNPITAGTIIRVPLPALTEERRKEYVRMVKHEAENARVAIRNIRRDANQHTKQLLKEKKISEDEERRAEESIQQLTDKYIADIDKILEQKEKDLMEV
ncbi:MAG: ribosome recycling factor [Gammaproteobacteria bacterium]|nr:ribosome recycling factor [Gammaproteobacteria bacterium]